MEVKQRKKPTGLYKLFSRIPLLMYRIGLSKPLEANTLVLTTNGRRSGKKISIPIGYIRLGDEVFIPSLYKNSDWLLNAKKDPDVHLQIGKQRYKAIAEQVEDPQKREDVYLSMIRAMDEKNAEKYYFVKPGFADDTIKDIGRALPMMRFKITG